MPPYYVVSAQKPTKVTHVLKANFTGVDDTNLIIVKSTRIEVHLLTPDGLVAQADLGIYGRVSNVRVYRPAGETKDLLFVTTEKSQFFVLSYNSNDGSFVTRANGKVQDTIGRATENGQIGIVDPDCRTFGLHLYSGFFKVIPMDGRGSLKEAFNIRLEELNVLDIQFLYGYSKPTIAVLFEDTKGNRHVKTYEVHMRNKELVEGPWSRSNVDPGTESLVPIPSPYGGVLVIGLESIAYVGALNQADHVAIPIRCGIISAVGKLDESGLRWLVCDSFGGLHVLGLQTERTVGESSGGANPISDNAAIKNLTMQYLGETSTAAAVAYLDNGVVFLGSHSGDSQLLNLLTEKDPETDSYVEVLETYTNLGPIVDFTVMDLKRQGQCQIVTCSGAFRDGSMRVVRNGIGIDEQAAVELPGIKGIWSLRENSKTAWDRYLVQSFVNETRILAISDEEMGEYEIPGFQHDVQTLYCANMANDAMIQVTAEKATIVHNDVVVDTWKPSDGNRITVATGSCTHLVIAMGGGNIALLTVDTSNGSKFKLLHQVKLEYEVACLAIRDQVPSEDQDMTEPGERNRTPAQLVAVGMWTDFSVRLLSVPTLEVVHTETIGGDTIPRSLLFASFPTGIFLFCGLGDGNLFTFSVCEGGVLRDRKKSTLGTQPISLSTFKSNGNVHVFAASDRPTVVYSSGDKLLFSNVNLRQVGLMAPFNSESFPDSLALVCGDELKIGSINEIQKLHIRTIPLGEQPRKIAHHASTGSIILASTRVVDTSSSSTPWNPAQDDFSETSSIRLFDDQVFEELDKYQLDDFEHPSAMICCRFSDETSQDTDATASSSSKAGEAAKDPANPPSVPGNASNAMDVEPSRTTSLSEIVYVVVGTTYVMMDEEEPSRGRILIFEITSFTPAGAEDAGGAATVQRKLTLIGEKDVRGAVFSMDSFQGKLLAGINSKVQLFRFVNKAGNVELQSECGHHGHILALMLRGTGDYIVVGDLMKSVSLLMYKSLGGNIEEVARDFNSNWMVALDVLEPELFIGAESCYNLFLVGRNTEAITDESRSRLETMGEFHLGEFVNKFAAGSLVMKSQAESSETTSGEMTTTKDGEDTLYPTPFASGKNLPRGTSLFGTINGVIGVLAPLSVQQYSFLKKLETALNMVVKGIGGLKHNEWRSFSNDKRKVMNESFGFIDGDLIETFLDLRREDMAEVVKQLNKLIVGSVAPLMAEGLEAAGVEKPVSESGLRDLKVDDVLKAVEELSRIH